MKDGTIHQTAERVTFRYERQLKHPIEAVWRAITDPAEMEGWLGLRPEIDLRVGGQYVSYHGTGDRVVDRVVRLEPPTLFEHTFWEHVNPSALVTWQLSPSEGGCVLALTHSLAMDDVRAAAASVASGDGIALILSRNGAGWHRLLDKLEAGMNGNAIEWSDADQKGLQERYAGMLA